METPKIELEEEGHIYRVNGQRIISTTQALNLVDDRHKDPWYLLRGRLIHLATQYYDNGELDEDSVDLQIKGYFAGYLKFLSDTGFKPTLIEEKLFHSVYIYAGKIDRIGPLNGLEVLIDLKSGQKARVDELQGAAYWALCRVNKIPVKKCFDLYLRDDGTYKLEPINNPILLLPTFLNILGAARWREGL